MNTTPPERGFFSTEPASDWKDALVTGNGTLGAMVMGVPHAETIILSHAGLFMPLHPPVPPVSQGKHLEELRRLTDAGEYQAAADRVVSLSHEEGWGEKKWTDPFVPAVDVRFKSVDAAAVVDYRRSVDFTNAVTAVEWADANGATHDRRCFVSRADNVIVVAINTTAPRGLNEQIAFDQRPQQSPGGWAWAAQAQAEGCRFDFGLVGDHITATQRFKQTWPGSLRGSFSVARLILPDREAKPTSCSFEVAGVSSCLLLIGLELWTSTDDAEVPPLARLSARLDALPADFDELLERSARLHGDIFRRCSLRLTETDAPRRDVPVESLLEQTAANRLAPLELVEKQFDAGRYAVLCSSGTLPPNLQGIWAGAWGAPWSGDYTQNGNLQTAIAGNLSTAMPECMTPYFQYLQSQIVDYRTNARLLFNARGIHVPSRTSSHGLNNHFDAKWPMTFWTAGAAWAAHFFYDYFLHTGDEAFMRGQAFPFMREAALFYEDFLRPGPDNRLHFSPSYSPENHPRNHTSQACADATMDLGAARQLLRNCVAAGGSIGWDNSELERWRQLLSRLPHYRINDEGALAEWLDPSVQDNYQHRHASHLYELFYEVPVDIAADKPLIAAFTEAVRRRMRFRIDEPTGEMAFGLVQLCQAAVSLKLRNECEQILDWLTSWYWTRGLTTTHNKGNIFNIDICGGVPDLIARMLVRAEPGRLELFPAKPTRWKVGEVAGLQTRNRLTIEQLKWSASETVVTIRSAIDQTISVSQAANTESSSSPPSTPGQLFEQTIKCFAGIPQIVRFQSP